MKKQQWAVLLVVAVLVAGSAGLLSRLKMNHRLGKPGLKVAEISGGPGLKILLPEQVLDYQSKAQEPFPEETASLPKDTTFGRRLYESADGSQIVLNVVLMGTDRTSIHQPKFCLTGQGWTIDQDEKVEVTVERPRSYTLPVMRITASKPYTVKGKAQVARAVYAYWFVADAEVTASDNRMWKMARELLRTGTLQRWAYVSCLTYCVPGQEKAAFFRIEQFISAAVPEFQLATPPDSAARSVATAQ